MVVIPARNEEAVIGRVVRSLPHDSVIVVDDGSTDRTAAAAREAGAGVLTAPDLPRNGLGKPNACAFGAATLDSRWVLFTDADTWFEPGFLQAAVGCAEASGLSLLSIYLDPEYRGISENILVPYARALAFAGLSVVSEPYGLFRGQCLLAQREPYSFMGGHGAVVTQIAEDVKLTHLAERHRMKLAIARAPGLGHVRLYQGYRGVRDGIRRQAFRFMVVHSMIGLTILLLAFAATLWLPLLAWLIWDRQWIAACIFGVAPTLLLLPWYPRWWIALLAPAAIYWILPALISGLFSAIFGWPIEWKGRRVRAVS
jgi:glycosyltransferase involved in cell wall biosynthesis